MFYFWQVSSQEKENCCVLGIITETGGDAETPLTRYVRHMWFCMGETIMFCTKHAKMYVPTLTYELLTFLLSRSPRHFILYLWNHINFH